MTSTFTQTSDRPYDKHYYVLHLTGGGTSVWEDYEELRDHWFLNAGWGMSYIDVVDRKQTKKTKGFK